jgi:tetratricopeptide (TPR) repeat protein
VGQFRGALPRYRLPVAAEEIKDPHNFLVRFATELGAVGLALVVGWLLALWWELTQRRFPTAGAEAVADDGEAQSAPTLALLGAAGAGGLVISAAAGIDWAQPPAYNALEVMRRIGFLCLFIVGSALAALRSAQRHEVDDRRAPWVLYASLVALGLFLLHNLVDFSLFEPGPMFLFAWLCGSALGARQIHGSTSPRARRGSVVALLALAVVLWVIAAGGFALPVALAERNADEGDEAVRTRRFAQAESSFEQALDSVGYNADYAFRAARAALADPAPGSAELALQLLDRAIAADPSRPQYWLHRAYARMRSGASDVAAVRSDYEQALRLDPNNVDVRIEYADTLRRVGDRAAAAEQYRLALHYNDLLSPDEPKRPAAEESRRSPCGAGGPVRARAWIAATIRACATAPKNQVAARPTGPRRRRKRRSDWTTSNHRRRSGASRSRSSSASPWPSSAGCRSPAASSTRWWPATPTRPPSRGLTRAGPSCFLRPAS